MGEPLPFPTQQPDPEPPKHLSKESKARWEKIVRGWVMDESGLMLLQAALEQWDEYQNARRILAKEGPTVTNKDSGMVRQHPAALVARDALKGFRLTLKDLGLDPSELK